jgi:hypothetical protein
MKRTPALVRLEKKLASDRCAILNGGEIRLLDREVRRALIASLPGVEAYLARSEDMIRWHALGTRCAEARGARGIREVSLASGIPQYRLRAIERGHIGEIRPDLACRYFQFLGIEAWVARWCRANPELARRIGWLDDAPHQRRVPRAHGARHGT